MNNLEGQTQEPVKWLRLTDPPCEDGIIETFHEDGKRDVARMIDGQIYLYDVVTDAPIIFYRFKSHPFNQNYKP